MEQRCPALNINNDNRCNVTTRLCQMIGSAHCREQTLCINTIAIRCRAAYAQAPFNVISCAQIIRGIARN